jgi:hypothetical protein
MLITYVRYLWAHALAIFKLVAWMQLRYFPKMTLGRAFCFFRTLHLGLEYRC